MGFTTEDDTVPCPTCGEPLSAPFIDGDPWEHDLPRGDERCRLVAKGRFLTEQQARLDAADTKV